MNNIYDNGELLLGTKKDILDYWKNNAVNIDSDFEEEVKEDLKDLKDDTIVCINYDNGMGYTIDYWDNKDIVNKEEKETRTCSECHKEMTQGYCIENGEEYYCSDECLHKHYTQEEYLEMYDNGNGDSYWTEWEC